MKKSYFKSRNVHKSVLLLIFFCLHFSGIRAQYGYSNAAYARGKMKSDHLMIPLPEEVVVEEYVNYHKHILPMPSAGQNLHMDLRWANEEIPAGGNEAVLQIGFTTQKMNGISDAAPLNLCLVIDKSGSMQGDRIENTRKACRKLVERLRPQDMISIVVFNESAGILYPSRVLGNDQSIFGIIDGIHADGSTDLNSGVVLGYREVLKNYDAEYTNKVILLTDALTNTGDVDTESIIRNANAWQKQNPVSFTIVGVGLDFNENLARPLADSQKNSIHFINNSEDIQKVFVDEIESLLSPVAREVELEITYEDGLNIEKIYGYKPFMQSRKVLVNLENMNNGLTQVVLIRFSANKALSGKALTVRTKLKYRDVKKKKDETLEASAVLQVRTDPKSWQMLKNQEVKKNYFIALMAQGLKDMAQTYRDGDQAKAKRIVSSTLDLVRKEYGSTIEDADIKRIYDVLSKYETEMNTISQKY
ncbi:MAG: vWA domain-containing protein [Cytophagaceae bacterium]